MYSTFQREHFDWNDSWQNGVLQIFLGKKKTTLTMEQFPLMADIDQCDQQLLVTSSLPPEALTGLAKYS